jgi:acetyl-CoA carboxylase biotin carboxyl carrier protein
VLDENTLEIVQALLLLAEREGLTELRVCEGPLEVHLRREAVAARAAAASVEQAASVQAITSPLAGVFYHAPAPDASPYTAPGRWLEVGQVVGLVEAMKVFNEITSHVAGQVVAMAAADGELVEQGQPLVLVSAGR